MAGYLQYLGSAMGAAVMSGVGAVATSRYMSTFPPPVIPPIDTSNQSKELLGTDGARCSRLYPDGKFLEYYYEDARTLYQVMHRGARISNNGPCLGYRPSKDSCCYSFLTYNEVIERINNFASGLVHLGMKPGQETYVGIYTQNRVEWIITEQACYHQSAVIVPLYDTLGPNACTYIINQAEIKIVICDSETKIKALLSESKNTPDLKHIIAVCNISDDLKIKAKKLGTQILSFKEIEETGKLHPVQSMPPVPADVATICYTSGTTGEPKGVVLTHGNIISAVSSVIIIMGVHVIQPSDCMISYLPLAHILEKILHVLMYTTGGSIGFFSGNIATLMDDIKALRPTFLPGVPRLLNKIYDQIQNNVSGNRLKKWLMDMAVSSKQSGLERHIITNRTIWDRFVFKPIQEKLGGRLRLVISGSAPLDSKVLTFLRCAFGCLIIEGYGLTETSAPCAVTMVGDNSIGHIGPPAPCNHIKLIDVPEMKYYAKNGQGEICIKGLNTFSKYFKNPVKTAETIDKDGWFHTGDIGMWLENGALKIIDRKKSIFKLAQGEYIAPEKIENIYLKSLYVAQIFVHGDSLKSVLVAIVVPDEDVVMNWCKRNKIEGNWTEICQNQKVKEMILVDLTDRGRKAGLKSFEQVKDIYLSSEVFSIENDLLTPTLKAKRPDCVKRFMPQITEMYKHFH